MKHVALTLGVMSVLAFAACGDSGGPSTGDDADGDVGTTDDVVEDVSDTGDDPEDIVPDTGPDVVVGDPSIDFWFVGAGGALGQGADAVVLYPDDESSAFADEASYPGFQITITVGTQDVATGQAVQLLVDGVTINAQPILVTGGLGSTSFVGVTLPEKAEPYDVRVQTAGTGGSTISATKLVTLANDACVVTLGPAPDEVGCLIDSDAATAGFQASFDVAVTGGCTEAEVTAFIGEAAVDSAAGALDADGMGTFVLTITAEGSPLDNGSVSVVASATHPISAGLDGEDSHTYTADNSPPTVAITKPDIALVPTISLAQDKDGDPANGIQIDVWATVTGLSDFDSGSVALWIDDAEVATATPQTGVVTFAGVTLTQNGSVTLTVRGTDACMNMGEDAVVVDVFSSAPTLEIVSPLHLSSLLSKNDGDPSSPAIFDTTFEISASGATDGVELVIQCRENAMTGDSTYIEMPNTAVVGDAPTNDDGNYELAVGLDVNVLSNSVACRVVALGPNTTTTEEIVLTVALPAPSLTLEAPAQGAMLNDKTVSFTGEADQLDGRPISVSVFQGGTSICAATTGTIAFGAFDIPIDLTAVCGGLADGGYLLQVDATDAFGNIVSENGGLISRNVSFDTAAPSLARVSPSSTILDPIANPGTDGDESAGTFGYQKTLTYELLGETDAAGAQICLSLNGGAPSCLPAEADFSATWPSVTLDPGDNSVVVTGQDAFGNAAAPLSETLTLILDAPVVKIVDPAGPTVTAATSLVVMVEVTDFETGQAIVAADVSLFIDGADSGITPADLGDGTYRFAGVSLAPGEQVELQAVAVFSGQEGASGFTTVTQKDTLPSIEITSPLPGAPGGTIEFNLASSECLGSQANCVLDVTAVVTDAEPGSAARLTVDCDGDVVEHMLTLADAAELVFEDVTLLHGATCAVTPSITDLAAQEATGAAVTVAVDRVEPDISKFLSPDLDKLLNQHDIVPGKEGLQHPLTVRVAGVEAGQLVHVTLEWSDELEGPQSTQIDHEVTVDVPDAGNYAASFSEDESGTITYPEGTVTLTATVSDAAGNSDSLSKVILVEPDAPSVRLTYPAYVSGTPCDVASPCAAGVCFQGTCWTSWGKADSKQLGISVAGVITTEDNLRVCSDMAGLVGSGDPCASEGFFEVLLLDTGEGQVFLDMEDALGEGYQTLIAEILPEEDAAWTSSLDESTVSFRKRQVLLDQTAPTVDAIDSPSETLPPSGVLNIAEQSAPERNYLLSITLAGGEDASADIFVNGSKRKTVAVTGGLATTQLQLDEGLNTIYVIATDGSGNASLSPAGDPGVVTYIVTVDTVAPTLTFVSPSSSPVLAGSPLDVILSSSKDLGQVTLMDGAVSVGTEVVAAGKATFAHATYNVLTDGDHVLSATVIGPSGNQASAATDPVTIVVDVTPPTAGITTPGTGTVFTTEDDADAALPGYQMDVAFSVGAGTATWALWIASGCDAGFEGCGAPSQVASGSVAGDGGDDIELSINVAINQPQSNKQLILEAIDELGNVGVATTNISFDIDDCIIGLLDLVEGSWYNASACPGGTPCASVELELTGSFFGPCGGVDELRLLDGGQVVATDSDVGDGGGEFTITLNDGEDLELELKAFSGGAEVYSSGLEQRGVDFTPPTLLLKPTNVGGFMTPGDGDTALYAADDDASDAPGFQGHIVVEIQDANTQGGELTSVIAGGTSLTPSNVSLPSALTKVSPVTRTLNDLTYPMQASTTVTLNAQDAAGNAGSTSFTAVVDTVGPAAVTLQAISAGDVDARLPAVTLRWTAVGDDGGSGDPAATYDVRYSRSPINNLTDFDQACPLSGLPHSAALPTPGAPGVEDSYTVGGPDPRPQDVTVNGKPCKFAPTMDAQAFYFAVRVADDAGNWSELGPGSTTSTDLVQIGVTNILFTDAFGAASGLGPFTPFLTVVVNSVGDVNGDGLGDFVTGFSFANGACLIFGSETFGDELEINELVVPGQHQCVIGAQTMLGGLLGGGDAASELGSSFEPAGDVNGDGVDDLLVAGKLNDDGFIAIFLGVDGAGPSLSAPNILVRGIDKTAGAYVGGCGAGNFTGDLNGGNPVDDIAIGELLVNRVRVLPGDPAWSASTSLVIDLDVPADVTSHNIFTINGTFAGGAAFGKRCQSAGDILPTPGGGVDTDDLLISQTGSSDARLFLIPGRPITAPDQVTTVTETLATPTAEDLQSLRMRQDSVPPEAIKSGFAANFQGGMDLTGDGVPDVLVSNGKRGLAEEGADGKSIYIFDGALLPGLVGTSVRVSAFGDPVDMAYEGIYGWVLLADANSEYSAVRAIGDWDGWEPEGVGPTPDIIYGHKDFVGGELRSNHETEDGAKLLGMFPHVDVTLGNTVEAGASSFGAAFGGGMDMTGDGRPDVVVATGKGQLILIR